jgi:hypothetical protein
MSRDVASRAVKALCAVVALLAALGAAAKAARDGATFLWPAGVVVVLGVTCLLLAWLLWRKSRSPADTSLVRRTRWDEPSLPAGGHPLADSASVREKREAAYEALLFTSEAYINAHRALGDFPDGPEVYLPELQEAENVVDFANQNFVAARQRVEQHGIQSVLDAALALENAINQGDCDKAARVRRDRLVSAVREDMNRSRASF